MEKHISKIKDGLKIENRYNVILNHVDNLIKEIESEKAKYEQHINEEEGILISSIINFKNTLNNMR